MSHSSRTRRRNPYFGGGLFAAIVYCAVAVAQAQSPVFTYQGHLADNGQPANGPYDLRFILYDMLIGGAQQGPIVMLEDVAVSNGIFTVQLDFGGAAFPGAARWLEIAVRPGASNGAFTILTPRQPVNATPYALRSLNAGNADTATNAMNATTAVNFSGVLAGDVTGTQGATQLANNAVTTAKLADANVTNAKIVSVDGNKITGTIPVPSIPAGSGSYIQNTNISQANSNFNISGNGTAGGTLTGNIVSATTQFNLGTSRLLSVPGTGDLFAGVGAGVSNTTGTHNTFLGITAGFANTTGTNNSFMGSAAGEQNTSGGNNAFFGRSAGAVNTSGNDNTFLGAHAGDANTSGNSNTFVGRNAGGANTTGPSNTFVGWAAGAANTSAGFNAFFGWNAGAANTTGGFNAFFGMNAGNGNTTGANNTFFGAQAGEKATTGDNNSFFGLGAGASHTTGNLNAFFGTNAGKANTTETGNAYFGSNAGLTTTGRSNAFFGNRAGDVTVNGQYITLLGTSANAGNDNLDHATAIGAEAEVLFSDNIQLGRSLMDTVRIGLFASSASQHVCTTGANILAFCSSSQRYKENVQPLRAGVKLLQQLRPVTFDWIGRREPSLGLIAEEVALVDPRLVTHNHTGTIEGVKYDQITAVLINAVKEQQAQIAAQQREITRLKKIVCRRHPRACR